MAAMATCTTALAGMRVTASAKAAPARMTAKTSVVGRAVVGRAFLAPRAHRAHRLVVRAEGEDAADAPAPEASMDSEGDDAPRARGACPSRSPPHRARTERQPG